MHMKAGLDGIEDTVNHILPKADKQTRSHFLP